jgi:RNA polymerase sigma-70 factor (ECF subfamily)
MKPESFEAFLSENEKRIYNYLLRFVEVDDDANDLVQNVFIAFYERIRDIDEKTATAYLYRMAHNMALNFIKQNKRMILKAPSDFQNLKDTSHAAPEIDYSILDKALQELPVKLSTVIHLQYYDNLSYKEISSKLGISVKAVESLLVRAKKQLRKKIIKENGGSSVLTYRQTDSAYAG